MKTALKTVVFIIVLSLLGCNQTIPSGKDSKGNVFYVGTHFRSIQALPETWQIQCVEIHDEYGVFRRKSFSYDMPEIFKISHESMKNSFWIVSETTFKSGRTPGKEKGLWEIEATFLLQQTKKHWQKKRVFIFIPIGMEAA